MIGPFIAVDWGTTSRRIYRIEHGRPIAIERDDRGAASLDQDAYPGQLSAIRARHGDLPVLLAGMVGSDLGWRAVPYVEAPASLGDLANSLLWIDDRTAIVPGVSWRSGVQADVMRGEEVQLLGAVAAGLVPGKVMLCQPGTHCKWVQLDGGAIVSFTTAMTGELFALLSKQGLLARQLSAPVAVGPAFLAGVAEGARRDLAASLFSVRARGLLGLLNQADAASFASGILIGADVAGRIANGREVYIVGDPELGALYAVAVDKLCGKARVVDGHAAFVAGAARIWELAR